VEYLVEKNRITQQNPISITHHNIAHDLYSSRVVISRLLKRLERAGKLELHRHAIELTSPSVTRSLYYLKQTYTFVLI